jgi:polyhydroxyalkanoate synthesis regulator phasin
MKPTQQILDRWLILLLSFILILSLLKPVNSQSDTAVRSELISLRNRIDRLESQIRGISVRSGNADQTPERRSGTGMVEGEVVGRSDPLFERLATLVIELKEDFQKLERRVQVLEKETVRKKP